MSERKLGDITVNDGKGLYDNEGLCDLLISDLNTLVKDLSNGQYIQFCVGVSGMARKLLNLKKGIRADMDSMKEKIEELKRINDSLFEQTTGLPVEKGGADNGKN
jgi:hypothetical protein